MAPCCRRTAARRGERDPTEPAEETGKDDAKASEEKLAEGTLALQRLIARVLVDPATTIPLDSSNLHRKVSLLLSSVKQRELPNEELLVLVVLLFCSSLKRSMHYNMRRVSEVLH